MSDQAQVLSPDEFIDHYSDFSKIITIVIQSGLKYKHGRANVIDYSRLCPWLYQDVGALNVSFLISNYRDNATLGSAIAFAKINDMNPIIDAAVRNQPNPSEKQLSDIYLNVYVNEALIIPRLVKDFDTVVLVTASDKHVPLVKHIRGYMAKRVIVAPPVKRLTSVDMGPIGQAPDHMVDISKFLEDRQDVNARDNGDSTDDED